MRSSLIVLVLALIPFFLLLFFSKKLKTNLLPAGRIHHLTEGQMRKVEQDIAHRRQILQTNCHKLRTHLPKEKKHLGHLRMDSEHGLAWCENYKVGSSTWAEQLLKLKGIAIGPTTQIHKLAEELFPVEENKVARRAALKRDVTFLVARHPFERLLSAYKDKLSRPMTRTKSGPTEEHPHWSFHPFGTIQQIILHRYRLKPGHKRAPSFSEFCHFLVNEVQPPWQSERVSKLANNAHWRPITTNCNLCRQRYSMVMHLDTLARDMAYLSQKLNLNIDPGFIRREGGGGRTSQNRTLQAFTGVHPKTIRKLYQLYRLDFELFGFSAEEYLALNKS